MGTTRNDDGGTGPAMHFVCTRDEARTLVDARHEFWVCNCGCRERKGECARSRADVCLEFSPATEASGSGRRAISRVDVEEILREAEDKRLVTRPFRKVKDGVILDHVDGICFCCDDCCGYFLDPEERCDLGAFIAETDLSLCDGCLACVAVCRFGARTIEDGKLALDDSLCYGCGLCALDCPTAGIAMVPRS